MTTAAMHTPFVADFVPIVATTPPLPPGTQQPRVGPEQTETYPFIFRRMITTRIRRSVEAVRSAPIILPDDVRDQALHILSFALKEEMCDFEAAWQQSRSLLFELAPRMEQMGHRHDWIPVLEEGIERGLRRQDLSSAAECQLQLGILYRMVSEFERARDQLQASIENFVLVEDKRGQARALNELAWIEQEQKNYQKALVHVQSASSLLTGEDPSTELERGICYRVQGQILLGLNNFPQAEIFHSKALTIFQKLKDLRRVAWSLNNLAMSFSRQQKFAAAIEYFEQSSCILVKINDIYHLANVRFNQGWAYMCIQNFFNAIACYTEAVTIYTKFSNKIRLSRIYSDMGLACFSLGDLTSAIRNFQISINFAQEIGDDSWRLNAVDGLAMVYLRQAEYEKAIQILEEAVQTLPQIVNASNYGYLFDALHKHLSEARSSANVK